MGVTAMDIAWLAGILEGEAAFIATGRKRPGSGSVAIYLGMTDADIVARVAHLWGDTKVTTRSRGRSPKGHEYKWTHETQVSGTRAVGWMLTLYALMGQRRRARIRVLVDRWKASRHNGKVWTRCRRGHPLIAGNLYYRADGRHCLVCRQRSQMRERNGFRASPRQLELA